MTEILSFIPKSPIVSFTVLLLVIITIPPIFERLKLPGLVGLLVAGVVLGKDGLQVLDPDSETIQLFEDIGKLYIMFVAGLEIDLNQFRQTKNKSLGFGFATFIIPLITGVLIGRFFDFSWNTSFLIGSLLASHTLLAYPIVNRLGVVRNEAVTITIGATIFTDISALLVLAICISIHSGQFSAVTLIVQLLALALYTVIVLFGLDWAGKEYFKRTGDEESNQFLFVLLALFVASVGAQIINVEKIVGAFLAGLAINDVLQHGPVEEKVVFVGSTLFIPFFFIGMGLLLDIPIFFNTIQNSTLLMLAIVGGLILSKFLAAFVTRLLYKYNWDETLTMWSLSLPQVAATLAAALAAFEAKNLAGESLINEAVFNTIIVLMLVTSLLGPIITAKYARKLSVPRDITPETNNLDISKDLTLTNTEFTAIVPVYNPLTERYLIEIAALLAGHELGKIIPLSVVIGYPDMENPELDIALEKSQELLNRALKVAEEFGVSANPIIRIDNDVAHGITRVAKENNAHLIIMGWTETTTIQARLFGNVIDSIFWSSHCPVSVMRLLDDPINFKRILVPIKSINSNIFRTIKLAQLLVDTNQGTMTLFHVCDRKTSAEQVVSFEKDLENIFINTKPQVNYHILSLCSDNIAKVIIDQANKHDLLIMRSMRRRTVAGLAVSDVSTQVLQEFKGSIALFGDSYS